MHFLTCLLSCPLRYVSASAYMLLSMNLPVVFGNPSKFFATLLLEKRSFYQFVVQETIPRKDAPSPCANEPDGELWTLGEWARRKDPSSFPSVKDCQYHSEQRAQIQSAKYTKIFYFYDYFCAFWTIWRVYTSFCRLCMPYCHIYLTFTFSGYGRRETCLFCLL